MNQRIRELAEQCWNKRPEDQLHFDNEKFAELIVRECAKFADKGNRGGTGELMKKHFGVEE
jgi:hypothetical protein